MRVVMKSLAVIVPASDWSISVYASEMTEDAVYKDYLDFRYEGSPDEVIILRCNLSEIYSNTMVTSKEGNMSVSYRPSISFERRLPGRRTALLRFFNLL